MIVFFSNRLNHHQAPVSDALYCLTKGQFRFVETDAPSEQSKKGSQEDFSSRPYLIKAWHNRECAEIAKTLSLTADVAIFGANSIFYEVLRCRNTDGCTFDVSERWLKKGIINMLSPRFIRAQWYYYTLF